MSPSATISADNADGINDDGGLAILSLERDRSCSSSTDGDACDSALYSLIRSSFVDRFLAGEVSDNSAEFRGDRRKFLSSNL